MPPDTERLIIDIFCIYLDLGQSGMMRKMLRSRELFPAVEGGAETMLTATPRKCHRDLPVFLDKLNDALEARDAEEYGRVAGVMRALLARHDEHGAPATKIPSK